MEDAASNSRQFSLLSDAARFGHANVCMLLLDRGATHERSCGITPLSLAAANGHKEVCELLIGLGVLQASSLKDAIIPLLMAAHHGHTEVCELLLDRGAPHAPDPEDGCTPLFWAAERGHEGVCRLLLDRRADVHMPDNDGLTPLSGAAENGHAEVCELLLDRGATHAPNHDGFTPLHNAAQSGHANVCLLLLDRGATHTSRDERDDTPLAIAACMGHAGVCKVLLDRGAAMDIVDKHGDTPLRFAAKRGSAKIVHVLLSHDGDSTTTNDQLTTPPWRKLATRLSTCIRAMLAQRSPQLFWGLEQSSFPSITSVAALIFATHTFLPHQSRRAALDSICQEMIATYKSRPRPLPPPKVLEIVAVFSSQPQKFFLDIIAARCEETSRAEAAILRGIQIRRMLRRRRERPGVLGASAGATECPSAHLPIFLPWWVWREILLATYRIPAAWVGDAFWDSPSRSCEGPILLLENPRRTKSEMPHR